MGLLGVDSGEASPSSKKLIMGNPEICLDFFLSFLDEFQLFFTGTFFAVWFMVRSCEISIFRAILSLQIFILEFKNGLLEIFSTRFWRHWGSAVGFGWSSSVIALDWSRMPQLLVTIPVFSLEVFSLSCF